MADEIKNADEVTADEFELFFSQESAVGAPADKPAGEEADESKKVGAPPAKIEPPVAKVDPPPDEAKAAEEKAAADKAAADKAAAEAKASDEKRAAADKAAADKAAEEKAAAAAEKKAEAARQRELSDDEKKLQEEVDKEFPEIAKILTIQRRILAAEFDEKVETRVAEIMGKLDPVIATTQSAARSAHEKAILEKHADAFDLVPEVEKWVETQPSFLRAAYNNTLDKGSAAAIVELFDTFKQATGRTEDSKAQAEEAARKAAEAQAEKERQKKLASQEGVRGRRTESKKDESLDFESAFAAAAKTA